MSSNEAAPMVSTDQVKFTVNEMSEFLAAVKRSSQCPLCPHNGNWYFHTVAGTNQIAIHSVPRDGSPETFNPVALMECPGCGFMPMVSLVAVRDYFRKKSDE